MRERFALGCVGYRPYLGCYRIRFEGLSLLRKVVFQSSLAFEIL